MPALLLFAFLAGVATVLSPCVLPVLPVILAGTGGGGALRPLGIVAGFAASFTAFTMALSAAIAALGVPPDALRYAAAALIVAWGAVLVVPRLQAAFARLASRLAPARAAAPGKGFFSGVALGAGLGLVWTPCAGPIMASTIALAATRGADAGAFLIAGSYSLGAALPMLAVMAGGRALIARFPALTRRSGAIQRAFGVLMLLSGLAIVTGLDRGFLGWIARVLPGSGSVAIEDSGPARLALAERDRGLGLAPAAAPALAGLAAAAGPWIGSPPLGAGALAGKVVLVDFWTYSCVNCVRTIPYLRAWNDAYAGRGLVIVGVHSPEFAFERAEANVRAAMRDLGVDWPVVLDGNYGAWKAFGNRYWPAHYLFDRAGRLVETHFGEGGYAETERLIASLIGAPVAAGAVAATAADVAPLRSPETYLGYARAERYAGTPPLARDATTAYAAPARDLKTGEWTFVGSWKAGAEGSAAGKGAALEMAFIAKKVFLVASPLAAGVRARVTVDGKPAAGKDLAGGTLSIGRDGLYEVYSGDALTAGTLRVEFEGPAVVYTLSFG